MSELQLLIDGIIEHARNATEKIKHTDPRVELRRWIAEANERETMVVYSYGRRHIAHHLDGLRRKGYDDGLVSEYRE